jgi:signal transduction histidine kinase/CHASE2 domain-containing sensor protein
LAKSDQSRHRRLSYKTLIGFFLFFAAATLLMDQAQVTKKVDSLIYDAWVRLGQSAPSDDMVIVGIDSQSVASHGRWPWSRVDQATIIDNISQAGADVIITDILYSEHDRLNPAADDEFARALADSGRVILPVITEGRGSDPSLAERLPISAFSSTARELGHVFLPIDSDGIVRRAHLKGGFRNAHWSILPLAGMEVLGEAPDPLPGNTVQDIGPSLQWRGDKEVLIPFHGPKNSFKVIPALDVLNGNFDPAVFHSNVVFFGLTASGLADVVPTPILGIDQPIPGVEVHANIYSALRNGDMVEQIGSWPAYVLVFLSIALLLAIYTRMRPRWGLFYTITLALMPVLLSYLAYELGRIWFAPLLAVVPVLMAFPLWSWHRLEFAGRFLHSETNKLAIYDDDIGLTGQLPVSNLFESAVGHLGLKRWFLQIDDRLTEGDSEGLEPERVTSDDWSAKEGFTTKRFDGKSQLVVGFDFGQSQLNEQFSRFVDNASRVQRMVEVPVQGGTIENLQNDADRLSKQNQRILQLKVLDDNIFNGSPAGLIVWNAVGEMMRVNEMASSMFSTHNLANKSIRDFLLLLDKDPDQIDRRQFEALMLNGESWQINAVNGSSELVVDFSVLGDELSDRLVVASVVDLSEIRRAERLRGELIEYLSHDLRSPLISSLYLVNQVRENSDDESIDSLKQVESNVNKTLKMIDDLLGVTRAEHLKAEQLQPVFFENIIENTVDQLLPQARQKNISLKLENVEDEIWISADASLLERAFINVVGNAIKYSGADSRVMISATLEGGTEVVTRVSDQGIGIPSSRIGMLFERFHRDPQAQKQYAGTGLGLALVAKVVNQHGGKVTASSVEGSGTTIEIRLPVVEVESVSMSA